MAAFASDSAATKYAAVSTAGAGRDVEVDVDLDVEGRAVGERAEGGGEAAVGEDRWVDPAREVAQLRERLLCADTRLGEQRLRRRGVTGELLLGHPEAHPERDEPRLRPVVEVALDAAELGVLRVHGAGPRLLERQDARRVVGPTRQHEIEAATASSGTIAHTGQKGSLPAAAQTPMRKRLKRTAPAPARAAAGSAARAGSPPRGRARRPPRRAGRAGARARAAPRPARRRRR